jgi:hypothetical protein
MSGSRGFFPARDNPLHASHYGIPRHILNRATNQGK